jgi:hypothetical protein
MIKDRKDTDLPLEQRVVSVLFERESSTTFDTEKLLWIGHYWCHNGVVCQIVLLALRKGPSFVVTPKIL